MLLPEEIIERYSTEERLRGLEPEERLRGLEPEERLRSLGPEARDALRRLLLRKPGNGYVRVRECKDQRT